MKDKKLIESIQSIKRLINTKILIQYFVFVGIATFFWLFITINTTTQKEINVPFVIENVPDSIKIITEVPNSLNISVNGRGLLLLKYSFGKINPIVANFSDYCTGNGVFRITAQQMRLLVQSNFEGDIRLVSVLPESLIAEYTDEPGKKVPIRFDIDVLADLKYDINGEITRSVDSVIVYSTSEKLEKITEVYTYHFEAHNLTDTLIRDINIAPIKGCKIEPTSIKLMVPVEPLIRKVKMIPVTVENTPENINVITFPPMVKATFLVPQSQYRSEKTIVAQVNFDDIDLSSSYNKVEVRIVEAPTIYKSISLSTDSVEFLIEKK